jgi:hypothetical protein
MPHDLSQTRVIKKLGADQPGAKKLARRFGADLVCVRYRQDANAGQRYTTVEIVVDAGPMPADKRLPTRLTSRLPTQVHVRIALDEQALQRTVKQNGAEWDRQAKAWRMPKEAALRLELQNRIVKKCPDIDTGNGKF